MIATLAFLLATMTVLALVERWLPLRAWPILPGRKGANLGLTATTIASNLGLAVALTLCAEALRARGAALIACAGWPIAASVALGIVVLDLSTYAAHRVMHAVPVLWRAHRVHHADRFIDVSSSYRQHPLETLVRFVFIAVPALALGLPPEAIAIYRAVSATNGLFEHANVTLWPPLERALSRLFVTPDVHKVHHSRHLPETDANYGNIFSLYDRLFGTFVTPRRVAQIEYGLEVETGREGYATLLLAPFRGEADEAREVAEHAQGDHEASA
jgi:sterol desaturase/sphingolipid hydroxylase (fatty acid hydroxylase superfamily)